MNCVQKRYFFKFAGFENATVKKEEINPIAVEIFASLVNPHINFHALICIIFRFGIIIFLHLKLSEF